MLTEEEKKEITELVNSEMYHLGDVFTEEEKKKIVGIMYNELERLGGITNIGHLPINDVLTEIFGNLLSQASERGILEPKVELLRMGIFKRRRK